MSAAESNWPQAPAEFSLGSRDIHVWSATLNPEPAQIAGYASTLCAEEKDRAARFRFERDRNRFIVGRGFLRNILAGYLRKHPSEVDFRYTERGKPSLNNLGIHPQLHFNLSHSHDFALLAVTLACPVGVDVERIRPLRDAEAIAERFFSKRESSILRSLPEELKPIGFFNLWTRKEAWLKATGEGISESLDKVEVSLLPDEPAKFVSLFSDETAAKTWTLTDLSPAPGFKGAIAIPANDLILKCWAWNHKLDP